VDIHVALEKWHSVAKARGGLDVAELIAEDAVFYSPLVFKPQPGRALVTMYLTGALHVLNNDSFHYVGEWHAKDSAVLEFNCVVDGVEVDGIDMIAWNEAGLIKSFKVMLRPMRAITLVQGRMAEMLETLRKG